MCYHFSQYWTLVFSHYSMNKFTELRKYTFIRIFFDLVGTTTSQNIRHLFLTPCISSECSAQEQVFHCKRRNQGCSPVHCKLRNKVAVLIGINRCGSFPCFPYPPPLSLSLASEQTLKDLKRSQGHQRGGEESGFG